MLEVPTGPATPRPLLDAGYTVGLLAAAILSGYGLLAPERLGLLMESEPPARVVASINPRVSDQPPAPPAKTLQTARLTPDARRARARPVPDVRPAPQPAQPERPRGTWSGAVSGKVLDQDGQALVGASVVGGGVETRVGDDGAFTVTPPPDATLIVKRPGYMKVSVEPTPMKGPLEVVMRPQAIKAAYLTYFGFGDRTIRSRVLDLLERTELRGGHRRQGRPRLDHLSDACRAGAGHRRPGAGHPARLRRHDGRPQGPRRLHDRADRDVQGQHPGHKAARPGRPG